MIKNIKFVEGTHNKFHGLVSIYPEVDKFINRIQKK